VQTERTAVHAAKLALRTHDHVVDRSRFARQA
jgi:hypothetical protein